MAVSRDKIVRVEDMTPTVHFRNDGELTSDSDSVNFDLQPADMSPHFKLGKGVVIEFLWGVGKKIKGEHKSEFSTFKVVNLLSLSMVRTLLCP